MISETTKSHVCEMDPSASQHVLAGLPLEVARTIWPWLATVKDTREPISIIGAGNDSFGMGSNPRSIANTNAKGNILPILANIV